MPLTSDVLITVGFVLQFPLLQMRKVGYNTEQLRGSNELVCVCQHLTLCLAYVGETHHIIYSMCIWQVLPGTSLLHKDPECEANTRSMSHQHLGGEENSGIPAGQEAWHSRLYPWP